MKWFLWIYVPASLAVVVLLGLGLEGRQDRIAGLETALQSVEADCSRKPPGPPAPGPAGMLGACLEDLEQARQMIKTKAPVCPPCPGPGAASQIEASRSGDEGPAEDQSLPGKSAGSASDKKSRNAAVQSMFMGKLGLGDPEFERLRMLVCAFKALRASILADLADGSRSADQAWSEMASMRKELADETQALLGEDRYAGFRAVGGIGALGESVDCSSPAP